MTQLLYGGYAHKANSVHVTGWNRQTILGGTGWPERLRVDVGFKAKVVGVNMLDCMSQVNLMQTAYSTGGQSLRFVDNNDNNTVWNLDSPSSIGGVMVTNPVSYGEVKGAEGTTYLYCHFALMAEYAVSNGLNYLEFKETLSFSNNGGNPLTVERLPVNAPPVIQNVTAASFFYATQSGELWSASAVPNPMAPLFPTLIRGTPNSIRTTPMNPKMTRGAAYKYGISWSYDFISTSPIIGLPNAF